MCRTSSHANNHKQRWHLKENEIQKHIEIGSIKKTVVHSLHIQQLLYVLLIHINMKYNHSIPLHEKNKSRTLSMLIYISSVSQNLLTSVLRLETNKYYNTEPCPDVIKLSIQNHPFRKLHILHRVF